MFSNATKRSSQKTMAKRSEPHKIMKTDYNVCGRSADGKHQADPMSAVQADDGSSASDFTVDYTCKHCGQSGAVAVDPKDIQWG